MVQANSKPKLYALLIGINFYYPNQLSDGSVYGDLNGAVNDITDVENFLRRQPKQPDKIYKLTSTGVEGATIIDPPKAKETAENLPTYANIVNYFNEITEQAEEGDLVYIHYSGHGGRAKSTKPELKSNNIDEALVPADIGTGEGQYVRDWELAILLERMVKKGLVVTVILDSCHSGGSTRGGKAKIRGLKKDVVDETSRPTASLVKPTPEELKAIAPSWRNLKHKTRSGIPVTTMIPEVAGYVLLAACRPSEFSYEDVFDDSGESRGALTYWLLDTLNQPFPGLTYRMIHDRIGGKINTQFPTQNPMILGEGDRVFLGNEYNQTPFAVNVKDVKLSENKILLNAGQAQGLRKGAEFAVYPSGTLDFEDTSLRLAVVTIGKRGATESWAEIVTLIKSEPAIEPGSQAVLTAVPVKLLKKVRLLRDKDTPTEREAALQAIEIAIKDNGWVRLLDKDDSSTADYQVDVKALDTEGSNTYKLSKGEVIYEICDRTGEPIVLRPAIEVNEPEAAAKIVKRLVHLTKFQAAEELDNHGLNQELKGKIAIEVLGKMDDYEPDDPIELEPFDDPENISINVGEFLFLKIRNNSKTTLNFTVLDLESNWAISQIEPYGATSLYTPLDPGEDKPIILQMALPEGEETGSDIFKVFATKDSANFRWLTLPSLDKPLPTPAERGVAKTRSLEMNALGQMLAYFAGDNIDLKHNVTRTGNPVAFPTNDWTTASIKIQVKNTPTLAFISTQNLLTTDKK